MGVFREHFESPAMVCVGGRAVAHDFQCRIDCIDLHLFAGVGAASKAQNLASRLGRADEFGAVSEEGARVGSYAREPAELAGLDAGARR